MALLQAFDNKLEKLSLQKLLMLFSKQQENPDFYFVPYKFGCFSFQANADLNTMVKYEQVSQDEYFWKKTDTTNYILQLKEKDRILLRSIKQIYGTKDKNELIRHTYLNYPYFAINSTIVKTVLSADEFQKVTQARPEKNETILFTIGYEGISLEEYLNKLIQNDIKVLCDVRKNPLSMKYGFSKSQLQNACEGVNIKYFHFPDVGIPTDQRTILNNQSDYDNLFVKYRNDILPEANQSLNKLLSLLLENKRIALTCFEANIHQCHRKHLAEAIEKLPAFEYKVKHL
ncbi:MAG: DUF488 domain-containing protein [Bacteroidota bacterium]